MAREDRGLESLRDDLERLVEQNWPNYQSELVLMASQQLDQAIFNYYLKNDKRTRPTILAASSQR